MLSSFQAKKKKKMNQIDILKWFLRVGITDCIGEIPMNRFQMAIKQTKNQSDRIMTQALQSLKSQPIQSQVILNKEIISSESEVSFLTQATQLAQSAVDLTSLKNALNQFEGCSLKKTAVHTLDGMGQTNRPDVLCLIDTPKSDDEKNGQLAGGDSGTLLLKMLKAIQLDCNENTYLAPVIPWRLPGDRKPTVTESELCLPFLKRRIELLQPHFILILGSLPLKILLDIDSISKARLQELFYQLSNGTTVPVVATFGPDSVKKAQTYRANAWTDLQKLQKMIHNYYNNKQKEEKNAGY